MKIAHYYHIWAAGAWAPAAREHHEALISAALPALPQLGITGPAEDRQRVADWAAIHGWTVIAEADEGYEQLTLSAMHRWALSGDEPAAVLYCHAKGARTDLHGTNSAWRRKMTERVVGEWPSCTGLLEHHDAVGCCWKNKYEFPHLLSAFAGAGIFAGNFWWATRQYIQRLPEPGLADRHDAEAWIGQADPDVIDMLPGWVLHFTSDGSVITAAKPDDH